LVANAAIVGPIIIATAINAAAVGMSPLIPKMLIPQLAIPKARTAKIIAMIKPMMLIARSFAVEAVLSTISNPEFGFFHLMLKTFVVSMTRSGSERVANDGHEELLRLPAYAKRG